jgi:hypothetical protein
MESSALSRPAQARQIGGRVTKALILDDGTVAPIKSIFALGGTETDDTAQAHAIVVQLPDGKFEVIECGAGRLIRPVWN